MILKKYQPLVTEIITFNNYIADTVVKLEMVKSDEHDAVGSVFIEGDGQGYICTVSDHACHAMVRISCSYGL